MKVNTKTKSRNIFISGLMTLMVICLVLTGVFVFAPIEAHAASEVCLICSSKTTKVPYLNGVCTNNATHYQVPDSDSTNYDVDGDGTPDTVYELANAGNLLWFAQKVNAGTGREYNAVLTKAISMRLGSGKVSLPLTWTPIGSDANNSYMGIFDGRGYAVSAVSHTDTTVDYVGFFGYVDGGTVKNLGVSGTLKGNDNVGGIAGTLKGNATVENCYVTGTVAGTDYVGGIAGYVEKSTIKNVFSQATVTGTTYVGGIAGSVYSNTSTLENCYYLNTAASIGFNGNSANGSAIAKTTEQFNSGEVAYLLGAPFGQNIDNGSSRQTRPYFSSALVYKALSCEGNRSVVYTNESGREALATHLWDTAGFCQTNDTHYHPAILTTDVHDIDGDGTMDSVYEISNAGQLYWFAEQVNGGNTAINGILTKNITVNSSVTFTEEGTTSTDVREWTPIGSSDKVYKGIFDGNNKTISKIYINQESSNFLGLFGVISGTVRNLGVAQSYINTNQQSGMFAGSLKSTGLIENCYSTGNYVVTKYYGGGFVGCMASNATIRNCWTNSTVSGGYVGEFVGRMIDGAIITNCYFNNESGTVYGLVGTASSVTANAVFMTTAQFASGEVAYLLGSAWGQNIDSGTAQSYPVLGGKTVYQNNTADAYCDAYVYSNTDTDIFPTKHYYDASTGICSHCKYQGEAKIGEVVYNTFAEAFEAAKGMTRPTVTVLKSIEVGNVTYRIESGSITIEGVEGVTIGGRGDEYYVFESLGGSIELKNIRVYSSNIYGAPVAAENGGYILISKGAVLSGAGCDSGAYAVDGGYIQLQGGTIENVKYGIKYACVNNPTANVILLHGTIEATEYAVYHDVRGRDCVGHISLLDMFDEWSLELSAPIFLSTGSKIVCHGDLSNWGPFEIEMETPGEFLTTNSTSATLNRSRFVSVDEELYVQYNSENNSLYLGECDHNELSYVKTGTTKLTETCAVCGGVNEVELHAPEELVYDGKAKTATVTGSFYGLEISAITYTCCDGGCINVANGKTHTAKVTAGSYTLTKTFVIQKAPGVAAVTIEGWKLGATPNNPVPSTTTNPDGITYYYKLKNADDSTYTTTVPTAEGEYVLKAVFAASANYAEVTAYANFAIGKETPAYTVPTGLTATYGDLLSSVTLPEGWSWKDGTQTVGNAGTNEFVAIFTPEDTETYLSPEVFVEVTVNKAEQTITLSQLEFTYEPNSTIQFAPLIGGVGDGYITYEVTNHTAGINFSFAPSGVLYQIKKAGGTFTLTITKAATDNYNEATNAFTITLNKANQDFTVSQSVKSPTIVDTVELTASGNVGAITYTTTDQYLSINGNVLTATKVGTYTITVTAATTDLYESATQTFTVTFGKAAGSLAPEYVSPTNLTVCVGRSTNDITLPTGWRFQTTTTLGQVGNITVTAIFTPSDTTNYDTCVENLKIVVVAHTGGAAATCTTAQTCTVCGETIVAALGHDMSEATCTEASACQRTDCDYTEGEALDHIDLDINHVCDRSCGENNLGEHTDGTDTNHLCDYGCGQIADTGCVDVEPVDVKCDECGVDMNHSCSGGTATCQNRATCSICGQPHGELGEHSFDTSAWGYTGTDGHAHKCTVSGCDAHDTVVGHTSSGSATETTPETCTVCGFVITPAAGHTTHTAETEWQTNETHHWHECTGCSGQELDKATHNDGDNSGSCDACGYAMSVTPPPHSHAHGSEWKSDEDNHWNECECGDKANIASHADSDNNGECDACGYSMSSSTGVESKVNPDPGTINEPEDPKEGGLGTGVIVTIVIASVAVVGGGGFALYWFVIRKKKES